MEYFKVLGDALKSWNNESSADYPGYTGIYHYFSRLSPEMKLDTKAVAFGDPSLVIDTIYQLNEWCHTDEILWQVDFGGMPYDTSRKTFELFIEKVLPEFSAVDGPTVLFESLEAPLKIKE